MSDKVFTVFVACMTLAMLGIIVYTTPAGAPERIDTHKPRVVYGPDQHGIVCINAGSSASTMRCVTTRTFVVPLERPE